MPLQNKQEYQEYKSILQSSINGIVIVDTLGRITRCNATALKYFNLKMDAVYLEKAQRVIPEMGIWESQDFDHDERIYRITINRKNYLCNRIALKDRSTIIGYVLMIQEAPIDDFITKRLEAIIESSYDGIYITDGNANTLMVNRAYEILTGLNRRDLMGHNMKELEENKVVSQSATLLVLKKKKTTTIEQEFMTGKKVLVTSTPIFDESGEVEMVVTNVRDITSLAKLQDQLEHSKELAERYYSEIEEMRLQVFNTTDMVANDERTLELLRIAKRIAKVDTTVLILGETGVGKEEIAKFIHKNSERKQNVFLKVNCGAIPEHLIESELFGYEKGAFTGAHTQGKKGLFEFADGGTLFLDEISELPMDLQVKLLRVLQEQEITRIGGLNPIKIDVRIVAATNRDLEERVNQKLFREDLYYRLNVVPLRILPLRERRDDILPLIQYYINQLNEKYHLEKSFSKDALNTLYDYGWPGNVRELKNIVERLILMSDHPVITNPVLYKTVKLEGISKTPYENEESISLKDAVDSLELKLIEKAYERHGNVRDAAKSLCIDASTFVRKRQRLSHIKS